MLSSAQPNEGQSTHPSGFAQNRLIFGDSWDESLVDSYQRQRFLMLNIDCTPKHPEVKRAAWRSGMSYQLQYGSSSTKQSTPTYYGSHLSLVSGTFRNEAWMLEQGLPVRRLTKQNFTASNLSNLSPGFHKWCSLNNHPCHSENLCVVEQTQLDKPACLQLVLFICLLQRRPCAFNSFPFFCFHACLLACLLQGGTV